jgi:hypothetical protein
MRENDE